MTSRHRKMTSRHRSAVPPHRTDPTHNNMRGFSRIEPYRTLPGDPERAFCDFLTGLHREKSEGLFALLRRGRGRGLRRRRDRHVSARQRAVADDVATRGCWPGRRSGRRRFVGHGLGLVS